MFEQLARYTIRYQESDLHLVVILLNLLTTSLILLFSCFRSTFLLLFSTSATSGIVAVLITKAGYVLG